MEAFLLDSATLLLRWLHVVAAIAWIGESFYFVALDRGLRAPTRPGEGLSGESWSVHGGGFYLKQKFMPAPPVLPEVLHWSKWKSYTTWISGFALLAVIYLASPRIYLIDPAVAELSQPQAIMLVLAFLGLGWLVYDALCRAVGFRERLLGVLMALFVLALCYAATHLFAGRAAFLLVGAVLATIMSANVLFVIIPGQKRMVAALARGEPVDPLPGLRGKQRSVHNTYFTLPVVFTMLSIHFPAAHAHPQSWLLLALFMAAGALIRQFFVLWHGGGRAWWLLGAGAALLLLAFVWLAPRLAPAASSPVSFEPWGEHPDTHSVLPIVHQHCGVCHGAQPSLMPTPPQGLLLDTAEQVELQAARVHQQTVVLRLMPPGNLTGMNEDERAALARWFEARGSD
ncbi:MAG TPA: urate hydroxylase PuuD [Xanthomonadaceae bacterium]|nr:urate hydroxylase PuuD [Xanthomonadaceae bacterium]